MIRGERRRGFFGLYTGDTFSFWECHSYRCLFFGIFREGGNMNNVNHADMSLKSNIHDISCIDLILCNS